MTLYYGPQPVPLQAIEPIRFVVREFVLIHSERGLTRYNLLDGWSLDD
jgi:2'-5' RNA ligase